MPRRRRQFLVPCRLAIVVRVHIDPAGRDQHAVGFDVALRGAGLAADLDDAIAVDRDIAGEGRLAGAVDNGAAANDGVVHGGLSPWRSGRKRETSLVARRSREAACASESSRRRCRAIDVAQRRGETDAVEPQLTLLGVRRRAAPAMRRPACGAGPPPRSTVECSTTISATLRYRPVGADIRPGLRYVGRRQDLDQHQRMPIRCAPVGGAQVMPRSGTRQLSSERSPGTTPGAVTIAAWASCRPSDVR